MRRILSALFAALLAFAPATVIAKPKKQGTQKSDKKKDDKAAKKDKDDKPKKDADTKPPIITHVRVTKVPIGKPVTIRARFDDESEIFAPSVSVRAQGAPEFESLAMKRGDDGWEATIPAEVVKSNLEYFIEVFDEEGNGPAREGSPENPIRIVVFDPAKSGGEVTPPIESGGGVIAETKPKDLPKVEPKDEGDTNRIVAQDDERTPRHDDDDGIGSKWWFWTLIGLAVTGGAVATVLVLQNQGGRVSAVDVQVIGPDPTRGL